MKSKRIIAAAIAAVIISLPFAGCGKEESSGTAETVGTSATAPATQATPDEAATTKLAETTAAQTSPSTVKATSAQNASSAPHTQGTTAKPVQENIPPDTVSYANINPNIGTIQNQVANEINELYVRNISLSETKLTLYEGESETLSISFNPTNAAIKTCTASADNSNASAKVSGKTVTVTAVSEGSCSVTVKAHSGATAVCRVTVKAREITDDTVLSHKKLCTEENANRWCEELRALCESLGLTLSPGLSGGSVSVNTVAFEGDASYNEMLSYLQTSLTAQLQAHTGGSFKDYEFNISFERAGGEVGFTVPLHRMETEE